jgi:hypothetical protein
LSILGAGLKRALDALDEALIHLEQTFAWPITGNLVARLVGASFQAIWTRE